MEGWQNAKAQLKKSEVQERFGERTRDLFLISKAKLWVWNIIRREKKLYLSKQQFIDFVHAI